MPIGHVVFDLDGTLLDTEAAFLLALQETMDQFLGSSPSIAELHYTFGMPTDAALRVLGFKDIPAAHQVWERKCMEKLGQVCLFDGIPQLVEALLLRGYTLGIVSDLVGTEEVDEWLDRDGLRPYFKTVQQSSTCLIRKPHPAIYYYALEECGADPHRTCYVGDNLARDIVGAKAAGLGMTIGVQYPGRKPQEITDENRPDRFISHFTQLLDIFPPIE